VHDVRAPVDGTVIRIAVDEGQLIAEDEAIATIDDGAAEVVVVTRVPGVVRELHVDPRGTVRVGDVIARIDES
jgi:biotin carboxyl carrier protein